MEELGRGVGRIIMSEERGAPCNSRFRALRYRNFLFRIRRRFDKFGARYTRRVPMMASTSLVAQELAEIRDLKALAEECGCRVYGIQH